MTRRRHLNPLIVEAVEKLVAWTIFGLSCGCGFAIMMTFIGIITKR